MFLLLLRLVSDDAPRARPGILAGWVVVLPMICAGAAGDFADDGAALTVAAVDVTAVAAGDRCQAAVSESGGRDNTEDDCDKYVFHLHISVRFVVVQQPLRLFQQ
mgnify:CR=1 FL=1